MGNASEAVQRRCAKLMAEEKKISPAEVFFPTVPKIIMYAILAFLVPVPLLLCADTCSTKWVVLAGYKLLKYPDIYILTFPRMLLMFATAYIASALIAGIINLLKLKPWHREEKPGKV